MPTSLTKGRSVTDASSYPNITASITPTIGADGVVTALVSWQNASGSARTLSTVTGNGLTWVIQAQAESTGVTRWGAALVTAVGVPTAGSVSFTFSGTINDLQWTIDEIASGVDTTTNHGIVQATTGVADTGTTVSATLAAFANAAANGCWGGGVHRVNEDISAGSGFAEITADNSGTTPDFHQLTEWKIGEDTTVDMTWATSNTWVVIAAEVAMKVLGAVGSGVTCTRRAITTSTANVATYPSGTFTPLEGELLVVAAMVAGTATPTNPSCTASANGITFSRVTAADAAFGSNAHLLFLFVANQLVPASPSAMTVTVDVTGDAGTGAVVNVLGLTDINGTGTAAVVQTGKQQNIAGPATPTVTFGATTDPNNFILGLVGVEAVNPAGVTPPANFVEDTGADTGFATPSTGSEYAYRLSGHASTTVAWGNTRSIYAVWAAEFEANVVAAVAGTPFQERLMHFGREQVRPRPFAPAGISPMRTPLSRRFMGGA